MDERNDYNMIPDNSKMETTKLNNMKQTAVEWLKEQYIERGETIPLGVFQQAKELEKEQIKRSFKDHHDLGHFYAIDGEDYYNDKYNQNK